MNASEAIRFHIRPLDNETRGHFLKVASLLREPRLTLEECILKCSDPKCRNPQVFTFLRKADLYRLLSKEHLLPTWKFIIYGEKTNGYSAILTDLMDTYFPVMDNPDSKSKRVHRKSVTVTI